MKSEVLTAADFLTGKLIQKSSKFSDGERLQFRRCLIQILLNKFVGHWYPRSPVIGHAHRAVECVGGRLDREIRAAMYEAGIKVNPKSHMFPDNFSVWCDPNEVSVRLGVDGSVWTLDLLQVHNQDSFVPITEEPQFIPVMANLSLTPRKPARNLTCESPATFYSAGNKPMAITPHKTSMTPQKLLLRTPNKTPGRQHHHHHHTNNNNNNNNNNAPNANLNLDAADHDPSLLLRRQNSLTDISNKAFSLAPAWA